MTVGSQTQMLNLAAYGNVLTFKVGHPIWLAMCLASVTLGALYTYLSV